MVDQKFRYNFTENKYYIVGGIIGLVISLLPITQLFTSKFAEINFIILYLPRNITAFFSSCILCDKSIILNLIVLFLLYPILGVLIAFLLKKRNN
ncbi:hypothetical protein HYX01_01480 [Candidatus Woesearchaeota archaeon]|nr:hypothetical protein [Candidatus Woesearchaeota archaeon]